MRCGRQDETGKPSWLFIAGVVIGGVASFAGLSVMLVKALAKVRSGQGLETYRTWWLVEFDWLGFLVLCFGLMVALVLAVGFQVHEFLQVRSLKKKYGFHKDDA